MAEDDNPATPLSMTLMAGPVDTRINPTKVNDLAKNHPIEWFEKELISTVPARYAGAGRRVYPGFVQLTAFMLMNVDRHVDAHIDMFTHLAAGRDGGGRDRRDLLRRVFRGARPDRRILPGDRRAGCSRSTCCPRAS